MNQTNNDKLWQQFTETGTVGDYLTYKSSAHEKQQGDKEHENRSTGHYSEWHGVSSSANR